MDVLVVGGSGYLGREVLRQTVLADDKVTASFHTSPRPIDGVDWQPLDLASREAVGLLVADRRPDLIINVAHGKQDWKVTADGAGHVAAAAKAVGSRLVHVSSDAVFSGSAVRYDETSSPDPVTPYGAAKAAAETAVRGLDPSAAVVRTSLIIGDGDSPREAHVRSLASGADAGMLFTDEVRCPVHVADLAAALLEIGRSSYSGILHVAGADAVSRYELGVLIARRDGLDETRLPSGRRASTTLAGALDVRLDCTATQSRLATRFRGAREFLAAL